MPAHCLPLFTITFSGHAADLVVLSLSHALHSKPSFILCTPGGFGDNFMLVFSLLRHSSTVCRTGTVHALQLTLYFMLIVYDM